MREHVASTTVQTARWTNSIVIEGDLADAVTRINEQPGQGILMYGFGPVAQTRS